MRWEIALCLMRTWQQNGNRIPLLARLRSREPKWWAPRGVFMSARLLPPDQALPERDGFVLLDERKLVEKLKAGTRVRYDDFFNRPLL